VLNRHLPKAETNAYARAYMPVNIVVLLDATQAKRAEVPPSSAFSNRPARIKRFQKRPTCASEQNFGGGNSDVRLDFCWRCVPTSAAKVKGWHHRGFMEVRERRRYVQSAGSRGSFS